MNFSVFCAVNISFSGRNHSKTRSMRRRGKPLRRVKVPCPCTKEIPWVYKNELTICLVQLSSCQGKLEFCDHLHEPDRRHGEEISSFTCRNATSATHHAAQATITSTILAATKGLCGIHAIITAQWAFWGDDGLKEACSRQKNS